MTREEALHFLGLEEDAADDEIKVAYREMSQILHPDRFNNNEKLKDRATEEFKRLNEARDTLTKGQSGVKRGANSSKGKTSCDTREAQLNARIAGIQAAREGLVAVRDAEGDSRRNGLIMAVAGVLLIIAGRAIVWADAIGVGLAVWGVVKVVNARMTIRSIDERLEELQKQKDACVEELKSL